ncbi:MAG: restriction endonuclease subunit S, partial [Tepidisphaeraceae bacterium]
MVPLGDVLTHRKHFVQIDELTVYKRCRVQLHAQGVVLRDVVPGAEIKTKKQQVCQAGEFLVAEIDAKLGGYGLVPDDLDGAIVSSHYFLFQINVEKLDRAFLGYFCKTPAFADQVAAQGSTNYAAIRPSHVLAYKIPLPPLSEQRRIVARIEHLAAKIAEARSLRHQAAEEAETLQQSGAAAVFDGLVARHPIRPLTDVVSIRGGGTPSKSDPFYWNGTIPWVTPKDMKVREIAGAIDHISERATQESSAKLIEPGAVLVVVRGMILAHTVPTAVLRVSATINQDMKA